MPELNELIKSKQVPHSIDGSSPWSAGPITYGWEARKNRDELNGGGPPSLPPPPPRDLKPLTRLHILKVPKKIKGQK